MRVFDLITLFGGLAMFLYGMAKMSDGIKENASGALKVILEKVTDNPLKAFALGVLVTAIIQSSSATIAITAGLVAAGVLTLNQSLGIIAGANVGTTITGQIIRLMDIDKGSNGIVKLLSPSTLAPLALIAGFLLIRNKKIKNGKMIGNILIGFGILFTGLFTMTGTVSELSEEGFFDGVYRFLDNPFLAYIGAAAVAFVLRGSATVGVLQTFAVSGQLSFHVILICLFGVYLGDSSASFLTLDSSANADEKRTTLIHLFYNVSKSLVIALGVFLVYFLLGRHDFYNSTVTSGNIADMNTFFNLGCAVILFPVMGIFEKAVRKLVKDDPLPVYKYADKIEALNPNFIATPALALNACYEGLLTIFDSSLESLRISYELLEKYDEKKAQMIVDEEKELAVLSDHINSYLGDISSFVEIDLHVSIMNNYYRVMGDFITLRRMPLKIAEIAGDMCKDGVAFSEEAKRDLLRLEEILDEVLKNAQSAFRFRNLKSAENVEPLSEVMGEMTERAMRDHMERLKKGTCSSRAGVEFQRVLSRLSELRSSSAHMALMTVCRVLPEINEDPQGYIRDLHAGKDKNYSLRYQKYKEEYLEK